MSASRVCRVPRTRAFLDATSMFLKRRAQRRRVCATAARQARIADATRLVARDVKYRRATNRLPPAVCAARAAQ